ncbi:hypothetical protein ACIA03_08550 [Nocardioides sp. NPDC051685]|uniref:hypothetical protein n=1 Tax=Nocardioides sp. NPDC051685 TaxID=3364334 RepID=UPI0037A7CBED
MPTNDSTTHAALAREHLRSLAHSTRTIDDPAEIYALLGDLSPAVTSMAQSLHQIARVHDGLGPDRATVAESRRSGRATSYAVSWELHRCAEMLTQIATGIDRAHEDEARISYGPADLLLTSTVSGINGTTATNDSLSR